MVQGVKDLVFHFSSLGCCFGVILILGQGTSVCLRPGKKKKKKNHSKLFILIMSQELCFITTRQHQACCLSGKKTCLWELRKASL